MLSLNTGNKQEGGDEEEEELDPKSVVVDDVIVGEGVVTLDENGPGAIPPKQLPGPKG